MNLTELKRRPAEKIIELAESMGLEGMARSRKTDVIFSILKAHARNGEEISGDGVLEILQDGFGFLRSAEGSYLAGPDDIYVSPSQIRRFNLRTGDSVARSAPPRRASATSRSSRWITSTSIRPSTPRTRCCSRT